MGFSFTATNKRPDGTDPFLSQLRYSLLMQTDPFDWADPSASDDFTPGENALSYPELLARLAEYKRAVYETLYHLAAPTETGLVQRNEVTAKPYPFTTFMCPVLIVGAGPVGLVMAAELARHGVACRIIDALSAPSPYCRALGITTRTLEVFEAMGILREALDAGRWIQGRRVAIGGDPARDYADELSGFPYANATFSLPQPLTEAILTRHLATFGVAIERGVSLQALTQAERTVTVQLESADGTTETAPFRYVVGCDGAHSVVRRAVGIVFEGETLPFQFMLGDVRMESSLPPSYSFQSVHPVHNSAPDFFLAIPLPEPHRYRVSMLAPMDMAPASKGTDHGLQSGQSAPTLEQLQAKAGQLVGEPVRLSDLRWSSRFRISIRLATTYQSGNVFIAGDAAHIHPPTGGQGMNTGIQDAYNLAWKLALVLNGKSPASLLDSYTTERRAEAENVIDRSVQASMNTGGAGFKTDRLADTQLLVSYRSSPWVASLVEQNWTSNLQPGDRAPDCWGLRRAGVGYPIRLFDVLRGTTHILLVDLRALTPDRLDELNSFLIRSQNELGEKMGGYLRIVVINSQVNEAIAIPGIGWVQDPDGSFADTYGSTEGAGWLIRPDGYISWCGSDYTHEALITYLHTLFLPSHSAAYAEPV